MTMILTYYRYQSIDIIRFSLLLQGLLVEDADIEGLTITAENILLLFVYYCLLEMRIDLVSFHLIDF